MVARAAGTEGGVRQGAEHRPDGDRAVLQRLEPLAQARPEVRRANGPHVQPATLLGVVQGRAGSRYLVVGDPTRLLQPPPSRRSDLTALLHQLRYANVRVYRHVLGRETATLREIVDHEFDDGPRTGVPTIAKWNWETQTAETILRADGALSNNDTKGTPNLQADLFMERAAGLKARRRLPR